MFVRFRSSPNDGFRPAAASRDAAYIACRDPWQGMPCQRHCRMKPRCRWRIGQDERLQPRRLKVVLVDNKRVDGKVKQETVAVLGSIDETWLADFWQGADALKADDWQMRSLRARFAFWKECNRLLAKLANRLGPEMRRIRMAVHARIPWPMELAYGAGEEVAGAAGGEGPR